MSSTTPKKKQRIDIDDDNDGATKMNPYTNRPYSQKYVEILETRKKLPVHKQKSEFLIEIPKKNRK